MTNVINAAERFEEKKAWDSLGEERLYHLCIHDLNLSEWIYEEENISLIRITKIISQISGPLYSPVQVAKDILNSCSEIRTKENDLHTIFIPVNSQHLEIYIHRVQ